MSNQIIKREDAIYKEIEEFKDYEITNNVAYEMMIRNDEFKRDRLSIIMSRQMLSFALLYNLDFLDKLIEECKEAKIEYPTNKQELEEYINNIDFEEYLNDVERICEKWNIYQFDIINAYDSDYFLNTTDNIDRQYFKINNEFVLVEKIKDLNEDITSHYNYQTSRPSIEIKNISKVVEIRLNLSLPKEELIATISKIKNDADKGNIKNPLELLGTELQKADNLICNTKGKCFDVRDVLTKQQKIADMFFIYDCLKAGMTQRKIQNEVYNYYVDKGIETITLDAKTLKKYKEIAIDYIDNMRYKELVTGVKLEDL